MAIKIYRSTTAGNVPASLADGQLAINEADEVLFYKNSAGTIVGLPMKAMAAELTAVRSVALGGTGTGTAGGGALDNVLGIAGASGGGTLTRNSPGSYSFTAAEQTSNKGQPSGYAGLDGTGKVPIAQIPSSVVGALNYQGAWNASTNSPALASGTGTKGFYYKVSTAGTTAIDGNSQWNPGDLIAFDGTAWDKIDGLSSEVLSVVGLTGAITATGLKNALQIASGDITDATALGKTLIAIGSAAALTAQVNALGGDTGSGGTKGLVPAPAAGDAAAGKFLSASGAFAVPPGGSATTGTLVNVQLFTASGTYTRSSGVTRALAIVVGGGGGSGQASSNTSTPGGGGSGELRIAACAPTASETVTIGAGGAAGGAAGGSGGATSFGSYCTANGGSGGGTTGGAAGTGGTGGVSVGSQAGGTGATYATGGGGGNMFSPGTMPQSVVSASTAIAAVPGSTPGAGASSPYYGTGSTKLGAAGAAGAVLIYEYK